MSYLSPVKSKFSYQVEKDGERYKADQFFELLQQNHQKKLQNQRFNLNSINDSQIEKGIQQKQYFERYINQYQMEGILSTSSNGFVFKAIQKSIQIPVAIKIIPISQLSAQHSLIQFTILKQLNSDKCIRILDSFIYDGRIYIVMDYMKYGTLHSYLLRQEQRLKENAIKQIMFSLFQGVMYLRSIGIIHRDLKPQNILIRDIATLDLVIGDFGQADYCTEKGLKTRCGSLGFMAPEMVNGEIYNFQADVYSLGAICFMLFHGSEIRKPNDSYSFYHDAPQISEEAQDFLNKCTETNPFKRITINDALEHPWFTQNVVDFDILELDKKENKHYYDEKFWLVNNEGSDYNKVIPHFSSMMIHMKH